MAEPRSVPIAIFLASFDSGGTERQMIELARRLDRRRWQVHLACFHAAGPLLEHAASAAASLDAFPVESFASPSVLTSARTFARWCRKRRIAILHTGQLYPNIFGPPAAALAGVPVRISNRRNLSAGKTRLQLAAQRTAQRFSHRIVANSEAAAACLRAEGVPAGKVSVVRNGIDVGAFAPAKHPDRRRRVVMVSNLRPGKGHDVLIHAAARVLPSFPDATFELVGGGPLTEPLRSMAAYCGVAAAFTFAGHQEHVPERLARSEIFVLPSRSESAPNALLEAMEAGLPVIASAIGGIGEIVTDELTGLLVPPDDPAALADRLRRLMEAPALGEDLGRAARTEIAERFSFDRMTGAFDRLYESELRQQGILVPTTGGATLDRSQD